MHLCLRTRTALRTRLYGLSLGLVFLLHGLHGGEGEHTLHARAHQLCSFLPAQDWLRVTGGDRKQGWGAVREGLCVRKQEAKDAGQGGGHLAGGLSMA